MNLHPAIPDYLSERLGNFLKPGFVGAAAVVEEDMRKSEQSDCRGILWDTEFERRTQGFGLERDRRNFRLLEKASLSERVGPEVGVIHTWRDFGTHLLPRRLD